MIYSEPGNSFPNDIVYSEEEFYKVISQNEFNRKQYVRTVTDAVNKGIAHYWIDEEIDKYNIRVPIYENYVLFVAGFIKPDRYMKYEFADYKKAVERGVGLCSQHALIISEILLERGIPAKVLGLDGHVVATAEVDAGVKEWWVLDGDYGVVIPYGHLEIEENPELVRSYYEKSGFDDHIIEDLIRIYGQDGNILWDGFGAEGYKEQEYVDFENASYVAKWVVPILLVWPFLFMAILDSCKVWGLFGRSPFKREA